MRIQNSNLSFQSLYYTKINDTEFITHPEFKNSWMIDDNPSEKLKSVVENSKAIKTLAEDTDVFVWQNNTEVENNQLMTSLVLTFKDPYDLKDLVTELDITNYEKDEKSAWDWLRNVVTNLEDYYLLKKKLNPPQSLDEDLTCSIIKQNDEFIGIAIIRNIKK